MTSRWSALLDQVAGEHADGLRPETLAQMLRSEEEVQAGMAVAGIVLLVEPDGAGELAVDLDGEVVAPVLEELPLETVAVHRAPPAA